MPPALIGLVLGVGTSAAVTRLVQSMLYQTKPRDLEIFSLLALSLLAADTAAFMIPAGHAAQLDPVTALRME